MKVKLLLNLSTTDFPAPEGEGPYLEGQERNLPESMARAAIARGWAVPTGQPVPAPAPVIPETAPAQPATQITTEEVKTNEPARTGRGR